MKNKLISIVILAVLSAGLPAFVTAAYCEDYPKAEVAIVRGGSIEAAVRKAIEVVGGIEGRVKKWDRVLIKVSLDEAKPSGSGEVTNVEVVRAIVHLCKEAGARRITVADGSLRANTWKAFDVAGYTKMAREEGVVLKDLDSDQIWRAWLPEGDGYKKYAVATTVLNTEVFINVPVIKIEDPEAPSLSLKNLIGIMCDKRAKRHLPKGADLDTLIIDMNSIRQSDLVVIDGTKYNRTIIAGNDPVSADSATLRMMNIDPEKINYIKLAEGKGFGKSGYFDIDVKNENL